MTSKHQKHRQLAALSVSALGRAVNGQLDHLKFIVVGARVPIAKLADFEPVPPNEFSGVKKLGCIKGVGVYLDPFANKYSVVLSRKYESHALDRVLMAQFLEQEMRFSEGRRWAHPELNRAQVEAEEQAYQDYLESIGS